MATSNTTPPLSPLAREQLTAGPPTAFTTISQQNIVYSTPSAQHTSTFQLNHEAKQEHGGGGALTSTSSGFYGPGDYPEGLDPRYRSFYDRWQNPKQAADDFIKENSLASGKGSQVSPSMPQSRDTSETPPKKVETVPNQAVQTVQVPSMQGMNFIQQVNNFQGANEFQHHQSIPPFNNFRGAAQFQPRPSIPPINNFNGHARLWNFNFGHNNQISNTVSRYCLIAPPPPYPSPDFNAPRFLTVTAQGYGLPQQGRSNANAAAAEDADRRSTQLSKKDRRKGYQVAKAPKAPKIAKVKTGRPPQLKALPAPVQTGSTIPAPLNPNGMSNNTYHDAYRLSPHSGSVLVNGPVPRPSPRTSGKSAVATRANDPTQTYGDQTRDFPTIEAAPPRNIDIGMLEICTFFPNWLLLPEVSMRAQANGWTRKDIVEAQLNATDVLRNTSSDEVVKAGNRVQKQYSSGGRAMFAFEGDWSSLIPEKCGYTGNQDLTANNWHFKSQWEGSNKENKFKHISLKFVYTRVQNWPQGADRLILTKCLEFAFANQHLDLDTSHFGWIMHVLGLASGTHLNADHDRAALERFKAGVVRP